MITSALRIEIETPKRTVLQTLVGEQGHLAHVQKQIPSQTCKVLCKVSPQNCVWGKFSLNDEVFGNKNQRVNAMKLIVIWLLEVTLQIILACVITDFVLLCAHLDN